MKFYLSCIFVFSLFSSSIHAVKNSDLQKTRTMLEKIRKQSASKKIVPTIPLVYKPETRLQRALRILRYEAKNKSDGRLLNLATAPELAGLTIPAHFTHESDSDLNETVAETE